MPTPQEVTQIIADAFSMQQHGDLDRSQELCNEAALLIDCMRADGECDEQTVDIQTARLNNQRAMLANIRGKHTEALALYNEALAIAERYNNAQMNVACLCNIGNVYTSLEDHNRADAFQRQALVLAEKAGLELYQANILCNIAGKLSDDGLHDESVQMYRRSFDLYTKLNNEHGRALTLTNIAAVLSMQDRFDECVPLYMDAMKICEAIEDPSTVILILDSLGHIYRKESYASFNLEKSEECLKQALSLSVDLKSKPNEAYSYHSLSSLYRQQERWQQAFEHFERYHDLMQETNSLEVQKMVQSFGYEREAAQRDKEIEIQKTRTATTRSLLHRVLPESIAERIMDEDQEIAEDFHLVSVLFADIKGFTNISARMPAQTVVRMLGSIFGVFDQIMKDRGCEKIKTIGDGYMAIAGAPIPCEDNALRLALAARDMMQTFHVPDAAKEYIHEDDAFSIRIGLHCGPVVGGVVGRDRFVYDVYSDTVNTASRMESHGVPGRIHCSEDYVRELSNFQHDFHINSRGPIEVKGKGSMHTYFLD